VYKIIKKVSSHYITHASIIGRFSPLRSPLLRICQQRGTTTSEPAAVVVVVVVVVVLPLPLLSDDIY
jgi:hypothetical protein